MSNCIIRKFYYIVFLDFILFIYFLSNMCYYISEGS